MWQIKENIVTGQSTGHPQKRRMNAARWANLVIVCTALAGVLSISRWKAEPDKVIVWDVISYYAYLPATFIYNDLSLEFTRDYKGNHRFVFWPEKASNGKNVIKTSMGLSLLLAPFFFIAHGLAYLLGYDTGGYSLPYRLMLMLSIVFYFALGLYFLRKLLQKFFPLRTVTITLLLTGLGTNLFTYAATEVPLSHVYSFALVAAFLWVVVRWYEAQQMKHAVAIGLLLGLLSLVRPTNILVGLFFLLLGITSFGKIKERLQLFRHSGLQLIAMALSALLVWIPQMIYWKVQTGHFLFFSYTGERFFFGQPEIIQCMFSYRKGWLVYTPVMILALAGLILLYKKHRELFFPLVLFTVLNLYVVSSWWCWWYGGSFGLRPMIDSYAMMALPLAAFVKWVTERKSLVKHGLYALFVFFIFLSAFQTVQYHIGYIHYDAMTKKAYWDVFLRLHGNGHYWQDLQPPDYENARKGIR